MTTDLMGGARNGKRAGLSPNNGTRSLQLDPARVVRASREAGLGEAGEDGPGVRRILVPLDGSHRAAAALPYAVALAHATAARIGLLAVVEPIHLRTGLPRDANLEDDERHVAVSSAYLESVATHLRAGGLAVTTAVRHGDPAGAILAESEEEPRALIAMGTHGRTGLARLRAGSVTRRVLRHTTVPVLAVPPGEGELTAGVAAISSITAPLDGSALAEGALPLAARLAAALAVPLRLLRAIPAPAYPPAADWDGGYYAYAPASEEQAREEERAVEAYLDALAAPLRAPGLAVETAWVRGLTPGAAGPIAEYLAQGPMGLAVMASHGRGGVLRWALGSTAEAALDLAPCPILINRIGATTRTESEAIPLGAPRHAG